MQIVDEALVWFEGCGGGVGRGVTGEFLETGYFRAEIGDFVVGWDPDADGVGDFYDFCI